VVAADEDRAGRGTRDRVRIGVGVMARAPSSGGKTRLAAHMSDGRLLALRRALLADTLRILTSVPAGDLRPRWQPPSPPATSVPAGDLRPRWQPPSPPATSVPAGDLRPRRQPPSLLGTSVPDGRDGGGVIVFVEPGDACAEVEALSAGPVACVPQVVGDLGRRMCAAFTHLLQTLNYDGAVLVGSDIPLLTADHLDEAYDALTTTHGVVLGPADDGGYYLIGMRRLHAGLFEGVEWGTATVLGGTLRTAERAGLEARLIRGAYDVDTIQDLRRLEEDLRAAPPDIAPHVRAWFEAGRAGQAGWAGGGASGPYPMRDL